MPGPETYRDSTQIVLPCSRIESLRDRIESEFTVTIFTREDEPCRIIGSPVEIKATAEFLTRNGVTVP